MATFKRAESHSRGAVRLAEARRRPGVRAVPGSPKGGGASVSRGGCPRGQGSRPSATARAMRALAAPPDVTSDRSQDGGGAAADAGAGGVAAAAARAAALGAVRRGARRAQVRGGRDGRLPGRRRLERRDARPCPRRAGRRRGRPAGTGRAGPGGPADAPPRRTRRPGPAGVSEPGAGRPGAPPPSSPGRPNPRAGLGARGGEVVRFALWPLGRRAPREGDACGRRGRAAAASPPGTRVPGQRRRTRGPRALPAFCFFLFCVQSEMCLPHLHS